MSRPFRFKVEGEDRDNFEKAIALCLALGAWGNERDERPIIAFAYVRAVPRQYGTDYRITEQATPEPQDFLAVFDWHEKTEWTPKRAGVFPLPFPVLRENLAQMLWSFASNRTHAGAEPDTDGSNELGWQVRNPDAMGLYQEVGCVLLVRPHWITYGK